MLLQKTGDAIDAQNVESKDENEMLQKGIVNPTDLTDQKEKSDLPIDQLSEGDLAPDFTFSKDESSVIHFSDFLKGLKLDNKKWVVLYFYPKNYTKGCTQEACDFQARLHGFTDSSAVVLGVSPDNSESHKKFKYDYGLNFNFISDPTKEICNLYKVVQEKKIFGKPHMTISRTTFLINLDQKIEKIWANVRVKNHINEIHKYLSTHLTNNLTNT
jgi:peroxiredoxin Q/BCP